MSPPRDPGGRVRLVRPYAIVGGRTQVDPAELPLEAVITTTVTGRAAEPTLEWERREIAQLCRRPLSVAELAARLALPVGTVRVLVSDMRRAGWLEVATHRPDAATDIVLLEKVLDGLRAL